MGKNQTQTNQKKKKVIHTFQKKKKKGSPENEVIKSLEEKYPNIDPSEIKSFTDFPLSQKTLKGLKDCKYKTPTDIQRESIGLALKGRDILGAAQTGSGKTLAFLIPVLEKLFCLQWTNLDGLGALIITPTRELAYQIFETLKKIGKYHDFSAGLVIGGKDLKMERDRMSSCNIMICTPGRLLQHMDENPVFDCVNMKILVLDEADRCLDMGFERTMNAIIENLPPVRQTLLFSATQTRSVRDLARLSLKDPAYVAVHEHLAHSTPAGLQQSYIVCELKDKLAVLWSFIKEHSKQKVIVFFASCKQAKYMFEIFSRLGPSTALFALYGSLHQLRRMDVYDKFCARQSAVLLATDLAARGLDFPEVHWVVQADCPEDTDTYIHRVGRTARYHRGGESLLLLLPSEQEMVGKLAERKIPVEKIDVNPMKLRNPIVKMQCGLAKNPELSESAKRAFGSYIKSVFLMKDKSIFKVDALDTDSFAYSLGLAVPPRIRFLQRYNSRQGKNKKNESENTLSAPQRNNDSEEKFDNNSEESEAEQKLHIENKKNNNRKGFNFDSDDSDSDDCLTLKRRDIELPPLEEPDPEQINNDKKKVVTKAAVAKKLLKHNILWSKKTVFNDEGEIVPQANEKKSQLAQEYENEDVSGIDIEKARLVLKEEDKFDKQLFKEKVKAKHKKKKDKLKAAKKKEQEEKKKDDTEAIDEFPDSDSGSLPDLSWLPDPDKVYDNKDRESEELEKDDEIRTEELEEESLLESPTPVPEPKKKKSKKRKHIEDSIKIKTPKKARVSKIIEGLSLDQAEEVALQLLK